MPIVKISLIEGRSIEKKHKLHKLVTAAVAEALDIPAEKVRIQLIDMPPENYSVAGVSHDQK